MLEPVGRADRQTLLDTTLAFWLFEIGVDRMHMTSEKHFTHGSVLMEADCDRVNPDLDQFTITIVDERGRTLRRERYTRADVEESSNALHGVANAGPQEIERANDREKPDADRASTASSETSDRRRKEKERERRWKAVIAATQPARIGDP
jgi:hypothetical protein